MTTISEGQKLRGVHRVCGGERFTETENTGFQHREGFLGWQGCDRKENKSKEKVHEAAAPGKFNIPVVSGGGGISFLIRQKSGWGGGKVYR